MAKTLNDLLVRYALRYSDMVERRGTVDAVKAARAELDKELDRLEAIERAADKLTVELRQDMSRYGWTGRDSPLIGDAIVKLEAALSAPGNGDGDGDGG